MDADLAGQAFAMFLVFGLLELAVWRFGRGGLRTPLRTIWKPSPNTPRALEAAERVALTPQHAIHLVRFDGRSLIVATHPQGCSLLLDAEERRRSPDA